MKYRIDNSSLLFHIAVISRRGCDDFFKRFEEVISKTEVDEGCLVRVDFGEIVDRKKNIRRHSVVLTFNDLKVVPEYDPNNWNMFPDVEPPTGVMMRVETFKGDHVTLRRCGFWDGRQWEFPGCNHTKISYLVDGGDSNMRFRPWLDGEEIKR